MESEPMPEKPQSACCGAEMRVSSADEGTACYICLKCFEACDPKPKSGLDVKEIKELMSGYAELCPESVIERLAKLVKAEREAREAAEEKYNTLYELTSKSAIEKENRELWERANKLEAALEKAEAALIETIKVNGFGKLKDALRESERSKIIMAKFHLEQVKELEAERDAYAELAAGKLTILNVNEIFGQQTLCSSEEYKRLKSLEAALNLGGHDGIVASQERKIVELEAALSQAKAEAFKEIIYEIERTDWHKGDDLLERVVEAIRSKAKEANRG